MNNRNRTTISCVRTWMPTFRTYHFCVRVGRNSIRPTNTPERGEHVQNRTTVSRNRARITTSHAYHFRPRVGAYCIRPTNAPERGEYVQNHINVSCALKRIPQNRMNPAYIRKWMTQIHGIRFLPKTFVRRMQYAPTRGRKRYVRGCGVRDRVRKRYVRGGGVRDWGRKWYARGDGIRFLPKTFVGRMQYAPTRERKRYVRGGGIRFLPKTVVGRMQYAPTRGQWYARGGGVRDRGRKWYVRGGGVRDWGRKWHMPIRIYHFKPYKPLLPFCNVLVWDR